MDFVLFFWIKLAELLKYVFSSPPTSSLLYAIQEMETDFSTDFYFSLDSEWLR